ncbi:MAG: acyltransferase family protein, partial [Acidobacteria bacterium]|nr:acyltransferase family protein [Acidobacteriota bacterium]
MELKAKIRSIFEDSQATSRLTSIEGIRGLSAFLIFYVHFVNLFGGTVAGTPAFTVSKFLAGAGRTSTDMFFIMSGFLIYGTFVGKQGGYFSFLRRRVKRLYPVFLCVLAFYLFCFLVFPDRSKVPHEYPLFYIAANVLLLPGLFPIRAIIAVAWILSYQMFLYITFPVVAAALRLNRWAPGLRMTLLVSVTVLCLAVRAPHYRMVMFMCGMVVREFHNRKITWRFPRGQWLALAAHALVLASFGVYSMAVTTYLGMGTAIRPKLVGMLFLSAGAVFLFALQPGTFLYR